MKIEIKGKRTNKLLSREEVEVEVKDIDATPSRMQLKKEIANKLHAQEDFIAIERINQHFGSRNAGCIAHVYESKEAMQATELRHRAEKSLGIKRSAAAKQATSSSKAEAAK